MSNAALWIIAMAAAYFIGAIPFGLLLGKMKGVDIREHGSGNIGATNARRVLGSKLGNLCFALDVLKGALPTVIAGFAFGVIARQDLPAS
ncbi:MAG: glycerol-3-phosphate acyltransferase, partial [Planctomycetota bacterium]